MGEAARKLEAKKKVKEEAKEVEVMEAVEPDVLEGEVLEGEVLQPVPHNREGEKPANAYDEEEKMRILQQAFEKGESIALVAKKNGIHRNTLFRWLRELEEETEAQSRAVDIRMIQLFGERIFQLAEALATSSKLEKASPRDLAIAIGILADKRKDILGPRTKKDDINLRVVWKDGSGAVEVSTGK